jgi:hypothetical protein
MRRHELLTAHGDRREGNIDVVGIWLCAVGLPGGDARRLHPHTMLSALTEGMMPMKTDIAAERIGWWSLLAVVAILIILVALFGWL